ncbi:MAG: hypothetical protein AB8C95_10475, partial [Phycisphaeraceae bacterium]
MALIVMVGFFLMTFVSTIQAEQDTLATMPKEATPREPVKQMTQRLYELNYFYFWVNLHKQVFADSDYSEQYIKDAEAVIDQFCRHLAKPWSSQFLKNPHEPMSPDESVAIAGMFLERYEKHEPLSFLIACNIYFASKTSSNFTDRCDVDPDLIREPVEHLITEGYPRYVEIYGRSFLRHVLLTTGGDYIQSKQDAHAEAFEQHSIMVDTIYGLLSEGCEVRPKGLDEQALFENLKYFWCLDQHAFDSKFDLFNREFALLDRTLERPEIKHAWVAMIFQAYYHNEMLYQIQRGWGRPDADGKYYGLTYQEHQESSLAILNQAWDMHPERPHAAFFAMNLSMAISQKAAKKWFEKGNGIDGLVLPGLYGNYRDYLLRRDTDVEEMLDYAYRMVDSGRFDTIIPDQMYMTILHLNRRTGGFPYFKHENFYEHFKKYC